MKKYTVLIVLFALPLVAYMFFASGVNSFVKLPIVTANITEFSNWKTDNEQPILLKDKITVLAIPGFSVLKEKGNAFNLSQKIYDKNKNFKDFQVVYLLPLGTEKEASQLRQELSAVTDLKNWHFVFASVIDINKFYSKLNLIGKLDAQLGTPNVFIIDKDLNLRGRKGKDLKGKEEYKEGYNSISAADLHNEMSDDVKIILAEYRLELKKNNKRKI